MIRIRINPEGQRLGNWLFNYAGAVSTYPDEPITFVIKSGVTWMDDPRNYSALWPEVHYEFCDFKSCATCGKCHRGFAFGTRDLKAEIVQKRLKCPAETRRQIDEQFGDVLSAGAVGISVRRGDYLKFPHTHPFVGTRFLRKAVSKFPDEKNFIVCSDDIPWCQKFFTSRRFREKSFYFVSGKNVLRDLFLPAFCRHNIISNSTFSWWSAYLNPNPQKRVIAPSLWLGFAANNRAGYLDRFLFSGMEIIPNNYSPTLFLQALAMWGLYKTAALIRSWK